MKYSAKIVYSTIIIIAFITMKSEPLGLLYVVICVYIYIYTYVLAIIYAYMLLYDKTSLRFRINIGLITTLGISEYLTSPTRTGERTMV